jgi:hypothetical protein
VDEVVETKTIDSVWAKIDRVAGPFFPPTTRKYISFLWITVFVFCIFAVNLALKLFLTVPKDRNRFIVAEQVFRRPIFFVPYDIGLLLLFLFVFTSKPSLDFEYLRALIFGMALAAILGQVLIVIFPW